ncbi:MAG: CAP domain-containing protein [Cyanobacteria bacterium P01_A01_bin.114]
MKLTSWAVFLVLGLALTSCGGDSGSSGGSAAPSQPTSRAVLSASADCAQHSTFFNQLLNLTNAARQTEGLPDLSFSYHLGESAQAYAQEMADNNFFSHTGLNDSTFEKRISATGYRFQAIGENLAAGYSTPQAVFDGWMASDGHRANLLSDRFTEVGLGRFYNPSSDHGTYWVQHFGQPSNSADSNSDMFMPQTCSAVAMTSASPKNVRGVFAIADEALPNSAGGNTARLANTSATLKAAAQADMASPGEIESVTEPGAIAGLTLLAACLCGRRRQRLKRP